MRPTHAMVAASVVAIALTPSIGANTPRFYPDDPLWQTHPTQDASGVEPYEIGLVYDTLENLFHRPGDPVQNVRAQNINTVDEVPDSTWFQNRAGRSPITIEELLKGPDTTEGPASGAWTVTSAKSDGVTPGFTIRDSAGITWFIKVDPPGYIGMATGTEVLATKLFWALGYHVAETHIAQMTRSQLVLGQGATIRPLGGGARRPIAAGDIDASLARAARNPDGSYRVLASRQIPGTPLGGFRFYGTRPDDPNDVVAHEHRRELRGYGTFSAWLNHVDSKSINTFDVLVEGDRTPPHVKHYLLDFGSTIGSAAVYPREPFEGWEYLVEGAETAKGIGGFGFYIKPWRTVPIYRARSVGAFPSDNRNWDPELWKARYSNAAFLKARFDDKFWAATKLRALTPDLINAVVAVAQYNDPTSEEMIAKFLVERREAILRRYFTGINPVEHVRLDASGSLTFGNAAVDGGFAPAPEGYRVAWFRFDNATAATSPLGESTVSTPAAKAPGALPAGYLKIEIAAVKGADPSWERPVHAYFRSEGGGWTLVGFERMPEGNPPTPPRWKETTAPSAAATR